MGRPLCMCVGLLARATYAAPVQTRRAIVALGSNVGDRAARLREGLRGLAALPRTRVEGVSSFHETAPVGPVAQGAFLNAIAVLSTEIEARELLVAMLAIERACGRDRSRDAVRWGPRTLDLDLLLMDGVRSSDTDLILPHPRMHEREFVLAPLAELLPDLAFTDALGHTATVRARLATLRAGPDAPPRASAPPA